MSLQFISIPGCESKIWTISVWEFFTARNKGVLLNIKFNFITDCKLKYYSKLYSNVMNDFYIQMSLQLISIPGCDNKSWTILGCWFVEA